MYPAKGAQEQSMQ